MNPLRRVSQPWRLALFLFAAASLNYADRAALSSVIPPLREDLKVTDVQVGIMGLLFLWSYAIASPFAGHAADLWPRAKIVIVCLASWSAITVLTGFAPSLTALFALRILLGVAESFYIPAAGALLGDYHGPRTRGKAMGFHVLGMNFGVMVGGTSAGYLAEHFGWRMGFWILGGGGLLLAAAYPLFHTKSSAVPARPEQPMSAKSSNAWKYLLRVPSFHILLLAAAVSGVASWIFFTWLPLYFSETYGLKLGAAGLVGVGLYKAPSFLGIALGGWMSDKAASRETRGRVMVKAASFLVSAPFLFVLMGSPPFAIAAAALAFSSAIRALGVPSEHPIICDVVPPHYRSTAIGLLNTCGTAAGGVGVLAAGMFKQDLGLNVIFAASSFLFIVAGVAMLVSFWLFAKKDVARARAAGESGALI